MKTIHINKSLERGFYSGTQKELYALEIAQMVISVIGMHIYRHKEYHFFIKRQIKSQQHASY